MNFTQVSIPRQVPCCETSRPAGWGPRRTLAFLRRQEQADPQTASAHTRRAACTVCCAFLRETALQKSLTPQSTASFLTRGQREPLVRAPYSLGEGESGRAGAGPRTSLDESSATTAPSGRKRSRAPRPSPRIPVRGERALEHGPATERGRERAHRTAKSLPRFCTDALGGREMIFKDKPGSKRPGPTSAHIRSTGA